MKYLYRISLIFMILTVLSACLLGGYYLYQHHFREKRDITYGEPVVQETAAEKIATDCDTEYVILEQNLVTGENNTQIEAIPAKYINKTKEQLILLLSEEERAPALRDREKGLESIRLSAFSNERVVVVKSYRREETEELEELQEEEALQEVMGTSTEPISGDVSENSAGCFFLMANNGYVAVYYNDMKTLYLSTEIALDQLPDEVRQEILDKKYLKNEEEVYNFLESYSS